MGYVLDHKKIVSGISGYVSIHVEKLKILIQSASFQPMASPWLHSGTYVKLSSWGPRTQTAVKFCTAYINMIIFLAI